MKFYFYIVLSLLSFRSIAQNFPIRASVESTALAGKNSLPFWFIHNESGKYIIYSTIQDLTEGELTGTSGLTDKLKLSYGGNIAFLLSDEKHRLNVFEAYLGISGKTLSVKAGLFADEELLGGLSSSNGNIVRSLNYRPYPMVRLSTPGFISFPFATKWLMLKAEYDEGLLPGKRIVAHPHLHHKSLAFQFIAGESLRFSIGADHYVMWGGTQPDGNRLPESMKSYFRYITGKKGSPEFLETDRFNVAGNQLGAYRIGLQKDFVDCVLELNVSHPFEDHSGMEFDNLPDNLYSFYVGRKDPGFLIEGFLFEFTYTKKQSGSYHLISGPGKHMRGCDNYFNHGVYGSGFTYRGYSLGTPLFYPLAENESGITSGFENNRVSAFHTGAKGSLTDEIRWKMMLTYSRNFGTFSAPYDSAREQVYSLLELNWRSKSCPLQLFAKVGVDYGSLAGDRIGAGVGAKWMLTN